MTAWLMVLGAICVWAEPPRPRMTLWTVGEPRIGPIEQIDNEGNVYLAGSDTATPAADLVAIRRSDGTLPPWPREPQLLLTNGDRLVGRVLSADSSALQWEWQWHTDDGWAAEKSPTLRIPLSTATLVWLRPPGHGDSLDGQRLSWLPPQRRRDLLRLNNGDVVQGTFLGLDRGQGIVRWRESRSENGETSIDLARVGAIAFNPSLARIRKLTSTHWALALSNGSRLKCTSFTLQRGRCSAKTWFGEVIEFPVTQLIAADRLQGRAVYLSELKPEKVETSFFGDVAWPVQFDRNVVGEPLRLAGNTYDRGLGTHSETVIHYALSKKWSRFEALVGLDDHWGRQGEVEVRVYVDGQRVPLPELENLTHRQGPKWIRVPLQGASRLTLHVGTGRGGDVQDHVNWCDARLIR